MTFHLYNGVCTFRIRNSALQLTTDMIKEVMKFLGRLGSANSPCGNLPYSDVHSQINTIMSDATITIKPTLTGFPCGSFVMCTPLQSTFAVPL